MGKFAVWDRGFVRRNKLAVHSPSATKIDNSVEVEQPAIVSTDRIMTGGSNAEDLTSLYKE